MSLGKANDVLKQDANVGNGTILLEPFDVEVEETTQAARSTNAPTPTEPS